MTYTYLREFSQGSLGAIALVLAHELPVHDKEHAAGLIAERAVPYLQRGEALKYLRSVYDDAGQFGPNVAALTIDLPGDGRSIDALAERALADMR